MIVSPVISISYFALYHMLMYNEEKKGTDKKRVIHGIVDGIRRPENDICNSVGT
jgi:hypothetical protein